MNKRKWLLPAIFSVAYAGILSLGFSCFITVVGNHVVASMFGESFFKSSPRFAPFCIVVGVMAFVALIALFYVNLNLSKKFVYGKAMWHVQSICAFVISLPMIYFWGMLFEHLREVF